MLGRDHGIPMHLARCGIAGTRDTAQPSGFGLRPPPASTAATAATTREAVKCTGPDPLGPAPFPFPLNTACGGASSHPDGSHQNRLDGMQKAV